MASHTHSSTEEQRCSLLANKMRETEIGGCTGGTPDAMGMQLTLPPTVIFHLQMASMLY